MNILYEDSMPYGDQFFSLLGDCESFSHRTIIAEDLKDIDILLVRSTTKVNEALLQHANSLKFIGTATAGTNHVDKAYLAERGIPFESAAGCNAIAVAEYVLSAMFACMDVGPGNLFSKTVGIVGAGNVGSALAAKLDALGINYKLCDPPLAESGDPRQLVDMNAIMQCDIISLHTPLVVDGAHPTYHMFDAERLSALSSEQLLINACRGEVLDNQAALTLLKQGSRLNLVMDVWENEPAILCELIEYCRIATAHIAGHTLEGKARGTEMLYDALCRRLDVEPTLTLEQVLPNPENAHVVLRNDLPPEQSVADAIHQVYNIVEDDREFRQQPMSEQRFAYIRKHYAMRREFAAMSLKTGNLPVTEALYKLGFRQG